MNGRATQDREEKSEVKAKQHQAKADAEGEREDRTTTCDADRKFLQLHTSFSWNLLLPFWEVVYHADRYRFPRPSSERSANASVPDDTFLLNDSDLPFPLATYMYISCAHAVITAV